MIQRVQSIWLLLAAITVFCLFVVPVSSAFTNETSYILYGSGLKIQGNDVSDAAPNIPLLISTVLAGLISVVNIFNFRNRKLQIRIAQLNILLILGLSFWLSNIMKTATGLQDLNIEPGLFFPLVAIIFTLLAIRGIKNDEKLIKSADRLR